MSEPWVSPSAVHQSLDGRSVDLYLTKEARHLQAVRREITYKIWAPQYGALKAELARYEW
jgi:hypothetical protein